MIQNLLGETHEEMQLGSAAWAVFEWEMMGHDVFNRCLMSRCGANLRCDGRIWHKASVEWRI